MAETPRISHVSYVVLGIVAVRGPTTSYQLKQYVSESIGYFWPLQHASLYREPKRLEQLGMLRSHTEPSGRRRQFFEITSQGLSALRKWITHPGAQAPELRDEALLKLHFGELVDPGAIRELAESQLVERKARLAFFADLERRYRDWPEHRHALETLNAGQAFERAFIAFWREISATAGDLGPKVPKRVGAKTTQQRSRGTQQKRRRNATGAARERSE